MFHNDISDRTSIKHRSRGHQMSVFVLAMGCLMAAFGFMLGLKSTVEAQELAQQHRVSDVAIDSGRQLESLPGGTVDSTQAGKVTFMLFIIHERATSSTQFCTTNPEQPEYTGYRARSPWPAQKGHSAQFQFFYDGPDGELITVEASLSEDGSFVASDPSKVNLVWANPNTVINQCGTQLYRHFSIRLEAVSSFEQDGTTFTLAQDNLYFTDVPDVNEFQTGVTTTQCPLLTWCGSLNKNGLLQNNSWVHATYIWRNGGQ